MLSSKSRAEMQAMWMLAEKLIDRAKYTIDEADPTKCFIWLAAGPKGT